MSLKLRTKAVEAVENVKDVHPLEQTAKIKRLTKYVPNTVTRRSARTSLLLKKNSPQILFGAGLVLGLGTVVTACKATLELEGILDDINSDIDNVNELEAAGKLNENVNARQVRAYIRTKGAGRVLKLYGPSLGLGVLAVASLTGSHHVMTKRNVALTVAYTNMEKAFDQYRERVVDKYGDEADRDMAYGSKTITVEEEQADGSVKKTKKKVFDNGRSKYARVFDEVTSSAWTNNSYTNRTRVLTQQQWANDLLHSNGHLFLNDVWKMLGMEPVSDGQIVGWVLGNGDNVVDFGITSNLHTDSAVHDFMFGDECSVLIDPNVDGPVFELLDKLKTSKG